MTSTRGLDDFPGSIWDHYPREIKRLAFENARAVRARRLYRRRGWNTSAVDAAVKRTGDALGRALSDLEFEENNPRLF